MWDISPDAVCGECGKPISWSLTGNIIHSDDWTEICTVKVNREQKQDIYPDRNS